MARTRRTTTSQEPSEPPLLLVSRDQFAAELDGRIEAGKELLEDAKVIGLEDGLQICRRQYRQWNDYNAELLARRFTNSKIADEYSHWGVATAMMANTPLHEKVRKLAGDIDNKIGRLESLRGRVELFDTANGAASERTIDAPARASAGEPSIFIVHGHDNEAKLEVRRFLKDVTDHEPVILHDEASRGGTVIEKFERVGSRAAYAVVLLTADDEGRAKSVAELQPRARQNVIFEFGYFVAKLGREKTVVLYETGVELPSDLGGLVYIELDRRGAWKSDLARELREAGVDVDLNRSL